MLYVGIPVGIVDLTSFVYFVWLLMLFTFARDIASARLSPTIVSTTLTDLVDVVFISFLRSK